MFVTPSLNSQKYMEIKNDLSIFDGESVIPLGDNIVR